jgi:ECF sigma factor
LLACTTTSTRVAERLLRRHGADLTLNVTTLMHETYLDLSHRDLRFADRPRFFAYAGKAMRAVIIDYVRSRRELVNLKFFCGLLSGEIATLRAMSERTVQRDWRKAGLFLSNVLCEG